MTNPNDTSGINTMWSRVASLGSGLWELLLVTEFRWRKKSVGNRGTLDNARI